MFEQLYARRRFGMRPGLAPMQALLGRLGNPEAGLAAIHVAGTNGKGSVTVLVAEVLRAAGFRVGRYTSPHLLRFHERFFLDGAPVTDAVLAPVVAEVESAALAVEAAGGQPPTFFECATAIAFLLFQRTGIRLAVVETGLGGRLDATNVLTPLISVITRIALDHCEQLGPTIEAIAAEKAGIIKPGRPVVMGAMPEEAHVVVRAAAVAGGCRWSEAAEEISMTAVRPALDGLSVRIATPVRELGVVRMPLAGAYQVENLATAVAALEMVASELGVALPDEAFREGLARVCWPARFQLSQRDPPVVVDGAHNPDGATALREALRRVKWKGPVALVAGFCEDKDAVGFLHAIAPAVQCAWAVPVPSPRTCTAAAVGAAMRASGVGRVSVAEGLDTALAEARAWARAEEGLVLVCGSLFLAGEALLQMQAYPWPPPAAGAPADPNELLKG
jgi:dihydrofolate synthase/folylpolyglutamate synthase